MVVRVTRISGTVSAEVLTEHSALAPLQVARLPNGYVQYVRSCEYLNKEPNGHRYDVGPRVRCPSFLVDFAQPFMQQLHEVGEDKGHHEENGLGDHDPLSRNPHWVMQGSHDHQVTADTDGQDNAKFLIKKRHHAIPEERSAHCAVVRCRVSYECCQSYDWNYHVLDRQKPVEE